jgi:phage repressor protein C with HTH and peptisase S24 domain
MVPTLRDGDAVLARYGGRTPRPGDVVLARFRSRPDLLVVKRLVRPEGSGWWIRGDNEFVEDDSRAYGVADVEARVLLRWWPRPGRL